jgi:hypothetical protein
MQKRQYVRRNANVSMGEEAKESRFKLIEIEMINDLKTHLDC